MKAIVKAIICCAILAGFATKASAQDKPSEPLGEKPRYSFNSLSSVPNAEAFDNLIWAPGLNDGFIPQGLTMAEGKLLVSAYEATQKGVTQGPSKVFQVDPRSGKTTGQFDLPDFIGHPGGLAYAGKNILFVANKGTLLKIDLARAISDGNTNSAILDRIKVKRKTGPSFLSHDGKILWFGRYRRLRKGKHPKMWTLDPETDKTPKPQFSIAVRSQGSSFDKEGNLWLSQGGSKFGQLQKIDPQSGKVIETYPMPDGMEDLTFSPDGKLWVVSEAGAEKYTDWYTFYPVLFRVTINKLKAEN